VCYQRVPMTSHNLDAHISWLLQAKPTVVPRGTLRQFPPNPTRIASRSASSQPEILNALVEATHATRSEAQRPSSAFEPTVNATREAVRPAPPPILARGRLHTETGQGPDEDEMARLASAPPRKTSRATLLYNQPPPASTTTSSLSAAYAASFHKNGTH